MGFLSLQIDELQVPVLVVKGNAHVPDNILVNLITIEASEAQVNVYLLKLICFV